MNVKTTILVLINLLLIIGIAIQSYGEIYEDKTIFAWIWVVFISYPIFMEVFIHKKQLIKNRVLFVYLFIAIIFILIQGTGLSAIRYLGLSLFFFIPFNYYYFLQLKSNRTLRTVKEGFHKEELSLNPEVSAKCKKLIANNKIDDVFSLLIKNVDDKSRESRTIILLNQKWKKLKYDKIMNIISNEWADMQTSRILNSILLILDTDKKTATNQVGVEG